MRLSKFDFPLPQKLINSFPNITRDEARLMVVHRQTGQIEHGVFKDILHYFKEEDTFVFNDTKVIPALLNGKKEKTGANVDIFLLRELDREQRTWDALVEPARKIRVGNRLYFGEENGIMLIAEITDNTTSRGRVIRFFCDGDYDLFKQTLFELGKMPIPKYLKRKEVPEDREYFQTVYAKHEGAVVAASAGLHFSRELMKRLEINGCELTFITIHSGLGNLRDIDVEDLFKHKSDFERVVITSEAARKINKAKENHKHICAIGTSILRAVEDRENIITTQGYIKEFSDWTNKFIFPPYDFSVATSLITNFQLPRSCTLMQVAAFGGFDLIMDVYKQAIKDNYHFGVYGDAMLIL